MIAFHCYIPAYALSPLDAGPSLNEGTQQSLSEMAMYRYTKTATAEAAEAAEAKARNKSQGCAYYDRPS